MLEEALPPRSSASVHTSSVGRDRPRQAAAAPRDEKQPFVAGHLGIAYANSKHEAEVEALRVAAHGLPVVIVNPSFVLGPDDPKGTSMGLVRRFLLRRIPAYVDGGLNIVDVRDVAQGHLLADEKGEVGERYILAGRNFTLTGCSPTSRGSPVVEHPAGEAPGPPACRSPWSAMARAGLPLPVTPDEVRSATQWWTYRNTKARKRAGLRGRDPTRRRSRTPCNGRWSSSATASRTRARRRRRRPLARLRRRCCALGGRVFGSVSERQIVLYRCRMPTNVLCPCGAVARRLGKLGLEHRTERVAQRRPDGRRSRS